MSKRMACGAAALALGVAVAAGPLAQTSKPINASEVPQRKKAAPLPPRGTYEPKRTSWGDPAIVLAHARPQDLFPLLAEHAEQPVVLIHSGWPWLEEGAYVASILPHVYLDVSITMPWASLAVDQKLEVLLGVAPPAKVLYGSDEASEPEVRLLRRARDHRFDDDHAPPAASPSERSG